VISTPETALPLGSVTTPLMVNAPEAAPLFAGVPPQLGPEPGPKFTLVALALRLLRFCTGC
jgi:hypothetical protein